MNYFSRILLWTCLSALCVHTVAAQDTLPRPEDVTTIDGIIKAYYEVVSAPSGVPRETERDLSLHHPEARAVITGRGSDGKPYANSISLPEFHANTQNAGNPAFFEWEIHREVQEMGNVTHVWSTYAWSSKDDGSVEGRGINSIQLYHDGNRYWITSWIYDSERNDTPIPPRFLPGSKKLPFGGNAPIKVLVTAQNGLLATPSDGRMFVVFSKEKPTEPFRGAGLPRPDADPFFGLDVKAWNGTTPVILDDRAYGFPTRRMNQVPAGKWFVHALFDSDSTFSFPNAPGNLYSEPLEVEILDGNQITIDLTLNAAIEPETLPEESEYVKYVKFRSEKLSRFWGKDIYLRAGIILPADYYDSPDRRYPVHYSIGGYSSRFSRAGRMMREGSTFRDTWFGEDTPRMIRVQLDGEGPFGDSYQINSDSNGPYGDATVFELIPYIERTFRGLGTPSSRFLDGGSTGGWVSLALQVFYPDVFNGAWSYCADGVDFRYFQLVDIYADENAFVNQYGYERPSMMDTDGEPRFSIRQEIQLENALGRDNHFVSGGGQWSGWNAAYGPRDPDTGRPMPIWDPETGVVDKQVAEQWKKNDLRLYLENNWSTVGPKLQGKLNIWMGDADNFYLFNAMRHMQTFLESTENPKSDAVLRFEPQKGHCWRDITDLELLNAMQDRYEATSGER